MKEKLQIDRDRKAKIDRELKTESTVRETLRIAFTKENLGEIRDEICRIYDIEIIQDYKKEISELRELYFPKLIRMKPKQKEEYDNMMNEYLKQCMEKEWLEQKLPHLRYDAKQKKFLEKKYEEKQKLEVEEEIKEEGEIEKKEQDCQKGKMPIFIRELFREIDYILNNHKAKYEFFILSKSQIKELESEDPDIIRLRIFIKELIKDLTKDKKQIVTEYPFLSLKTIEYDRIIYPTIISLCLWFLK